MKRGFKESESVRVRALGVGTCEVFFFFDITGLPCSLFA